ncbi:fungal-specific transcription factor domain-containing protein [Boeremia exigua]|uniref:fungal-specific transcription factor domain-containing protein n=1 Tax=Boeremia exigua TaxID=749465 RepID=UPI001E8E6C7B|nr:fungal-specific transcription factor domain-containing protein [Boeremia exigua]KAH6628977.1 fungal-specific transcription factor domain-containing protein [Boeremia exigua]
MPATYRVRFSSSQPARFAHVPQPTATETESQLHGRTRRKSRGGCRECKRRRVKCDERFPICVRCQRRGSVCLMDPKASTWQLELPGLTMQRSPSNTALIGSHVDARLLRRWLDRTSQIMVLNPDTNPLSYPLLAALQPCPWLASVLQSISAAHERNFSQSASTACVVHRGHALREFSRQLSSPDPPLAAMLLGVFLLGVSSCWIDADPSQYGGEHILGGRAIFDMLLARDASKREPLDWLAISCWIYWDMACSLCVDPAVQTPMDSPAVYSAIAAMKGDYHCMMGYSVQLYHLLGTLGRYCRGVISLGEKDLVLECLLEEQLLETKGPNPIPDNELAWLEEAYRLHGLILLYRICGVQPYLLREWDDPDDHIHQLALQAVHLLSLIPIDSCYLTMQPIPLLTASAELWDEDVQERDDVTRRFKALYSANRTPVNVWALQMIRELWELRSIGIVVSWVDLMISKNWCFTLG